MTTVCEKNVTLRMLALVNCSGRSSEFAGRTYLLDTEERIVNGKKG